MADNVFCASLDLTPAVYANGKMTALGGSRPSEETVAAMAEAARGHVVMDDLLTAAGPSTRASDGR
ncbi:hypothetical protein [Streptomyces sp. NPDC053560]|uniref:hypothetical protein n=1 Tax=Streptomyces sp. NPDC053560 TaxID=3365711 RepID=UPI0037D759AB